MARLQQIFAGFVVGAAVAASVGAQVSSGPLDPTRGLTASAAPVRAALPEEYVWTAGDVTALRTDHNKFSWNRPDLRVGPHLFRAKFRVSVVPKAATLYVAGPREAHVFLNGRRVDDFFLDTDAPIGFHVFHAAVGGALRVGENVLAIEAVRGRGVVSGTSPVATQQLAYGEVLAVKIVPERFGMEGKALVVSDGKWRSVTSASGDWRGVGFDDSKWPLAESLGPIDANADLRQWSVDAGMYGWPGYVGMSPALRTFSLTAKAATHVFAGRGGFANLDSLTSEKGIALFAVTNTHRETDTDADAPSFVLDFGREVAGRLVVESGSETDAALSIAYGESEIEAMATGLTPGQQGGNYLGTNVLELPAHGVARGPKSGFRFVRVRFLRGAVVSAFKSIRVEGIYYPVTYAGSFESSDPLLNRIWETGAYTVHLCMQDGVWDAVKRDRGRWAGDLDLEGRVISTVFGDRAELEDTLRSLVPSGVGYVNGIPSYSALWITTLADFYQHSGDKEFLGSQREAMLHVLAGMDAGLDANGLFGNAKHDWMFVDWAPGLYAYTPDAQVGTQLQFVRGYRAAAELFRAMGDDADAQRYDAQAEKALAAAHGLRDANGVTYGATWQLNALAALLSDARPEVVWSDVLSHVKQDAPGDQVISPYFNTYVLDAMAASGHRREALDWIRTYWGGMLAEGATSFWESYDLRWPKTNPHLSLQADGTSGYFVSLAHGWSAGPTAWLSENVLGITPASAGYDTVNVRPNLLGLEYANGSVATPHGPIAIRVDRVKGIELELPVGVTRTAVVYQVPMAGTAVYVDGKLRCEQCGDELRVEIREPGRHTIGPK